MRAQCCRTNNERLHARIVLNNQEAYSSAEVAMAERFLATGDPAPFLKAAKLLFVSRFPGSAGTE